VNAEQLLCGVRGREHIPDAIVYLRSSYEKLLIEPIVHAEREQIMIVVEEPNATF